MRTIHELHDRFDIEFLQKDIRKKLLGDNSSMEYYKERDVMLPVSEDFLKNVVPYVTQYDTIVPEVSNLTLEVIGWTVLPFSVTMVT